MDVAGSVSAGTCTRVTPAIRKSRESHWYKPNLFPSIETENRAVVKIFSWYVTCVQHNTNTPLSNVEGFVNVTGEHDLHNPEQ